MNDERVEQAARAALARRRAATVPDGLAERLDRIPDEVRPLAAAPVRLAIAVLPWAAVAVAGLVLAFGPRLVALTSSTGAAAPPVTWDPASPGGGFASLGWFGLPWVPALPFVAVLGAFWAIRRARSGRPLVPKLAFDRNAPKRPMTRNERVACVLVVVVGLVATVAAPRDWDPLVYDFGAGPGPGYSEIREDGQFLVEGQAQAFDVQTGEHVVYQLRPGQPFTYVVTVQNGGPVPVTILGWQREPNVSTASLLLGNAFVTTGLGILGHPDAIFDPNDILPFHPVTLAPGDFVAIAVASVAGACADPSASVPIRDPSVEDGVPLAETLTWVPLIYDVFGWRRIGYVFPPFEVTVASKSGCVQDQPALPRPYDVNGRLDLPG